MYKTSNNNDQSNYIQNNTSKYVYNPGAKKTRFDCGFLRLNIKKFDQ